MGTLKRNSFIKIVLKIILLTLLIYLFIYILGINDTPIYHNKTVLDIRNETNNVISSMELSAYTPYGFIMPEGANYYKDIIAIPKIESKERLILVIDQSKISVPGMGLSLKYKSFDKILGVFKSEKSRLYSDKGFTTVITLKKGGEIQVEEVRNLLIDKNKTFYFKKYSKVFEWENFKWTEL